MGSSMEDQLYNAILHSDVKNVTKLLRQGANINKLYKGRTFLGLAAEAGEPKVFGSVLAAIVNQNPKTENEAHRNKKLRSERSNNSNETSSSSHKNLGYFIMVHGENDENNTIEQPVEEKTPEGMDGLEWDVEIKENQGENPPDQDSWVTLYKWYADILDKAGDMLKVPIIYDINQQDETGWTALHYAAKNGHMQASQMLINAGCQLDIASGDNQTPLHAACLGSSPEMVTLLLESGAHVNPRMSNKKTPMHLAAVRDRGTVIEMLCQYGAVIDAQDAQDRTPLAAAIMTKAYNAVTTLLRLGAKPNLEDIHGYTPLCEAVWLNSEQMVRVLLEYGAKITQSHCLLHSAVWHQDATIAQLLLDAGSVPNAGNDEGESPLIIAIRMGDVKMAELLLNYGACTNHMSSYGDSVIHEAVDHLDDVQEFEAMFRLLIKHGADPNLHSCQFFDLTPISRALFYDRAAIVAILIRHGTDINRFDPLLREYNLCVARRKQYFPTVKLIVYAGFDVRKSTEDIPHLPDNSCYKTDTLNGWLGYVKHNPLSLEELCRIHIRTRFGTRVYERVDKLPIPTLLKSYLKLLDVNE